jgi:hypothetical protein
MSMELPEHLRSGPLADAARQSLADAQAMSAASNSIPRISFRGREFRLQNNGEEVAKFRDHLDVVILGVEPAGPLMCKSYYEKGYVPGAKEPPDCASDDGISPAPYVSKKQNPTCRDCKWNQFGSAISPNGKPTKKCRDSKRIWLKVADGNKVGDKPFEQPSFTDRTMYGVNISVASLKSFAEHGRLLAGMGQGPAVCVTRLSMVDSEFTQVEFSLNAWLDATTAPLSLKLAADRPWKMFTSAGLALSAPEAGSQRAGLPSALPGQPPAHLQELTKQANVGGQPAEVMDAPATQVKPVADGDIDDAVATF